MRHGKALICTVVLAGALLLTSSCYYGPHHPPHGHVYVYGGVDMVFDSGLGLYIVTGYPDCYFWGGHYYRYHAPYWEYSTGIHGPWRVERRYDALPPALRERHEFREPPPARGRGGPGGPPGRGRGEPQGRGRGRGPE